MIVFNNWLKENEYRRYPLADDCASPLPDSAIVDAFINPIDAADGAVCLVGVDTDSVVFADAAGARYATASRSGASLNLEDQYGRPCGVVVAGPSFDSIGQADFTYGQLPLAGACVFRDDRAGVRGFLMPDGVLISGDVTWIGRNGVVVDSRIDDAGRSVLRFSFYGFVATPECAELPEPVTCIRLLQEGGGSLSLSTSELGVINIGHTAETLDAVCKSGATKSRVPVAKVAPVGEEECGSAAPQGVSPCAPPPPPPPPGPGLPRMLYDCPRDSSTLKGEYHIVSASPVLGVRTIETGGEGLPRAGHGVEIYVKGADANQ